MPEASPFKHVEADDSAGFLLWKITALWQRKPNMQLWLR
jgi:MarR family transcriptional regulator for hemolysin